MFPFRFPLHQGFSEGWGLYSETLGREFGLYSEPLVRFGHLGAEMFRACRLVVDTGIHHLGWSREKAVRYLMDLNNYPEDMIRREISRYVTMPGQAVSYKVGQIKILQLRERAKKALGEGFDLKSFHEVVLRAAGPLSIVEDEVNKVKII